MIITDRYGGNDRDDGADGRAHARKTGHGQEPGEHVPTESTRPLAEDSGRGTGLGQAGTSDPEDTDGIASSQGGGIEGAIGGGQSGQGGG